MRIEVGLTTAPSVPAGARTVPAELRYQACDDRRCYFPGSLPVELHVIVTE